MTSPVDDRDLLDRATRALRDDAASDPPAVDESWRAMESWRHVSRDVRQGARRRRLGLIVALQLVAAVAGVGAWAAASGRLPPILSRWVAAVHPAAAPGAPVRVRAPRARREAFNPPPASPPPEAPPPPPAVAAPPVSRAVYPAPRPFRPAIPPAPAAAAGPEEIYARAHRAQFAQRDYVAALALWDEYLATTGGTLGLEARWNRAIALVRLGRRDQAVAALAPFAAGQNEGYRQEEAQALLRVLGAAAP